MTEFDRAAAEQTLQDAGATKASNSAWWILPFNDDEGNPVRANGAKAALARLEAGPGAAAPQVAAAHDDTPDDDDEPAAPAPAPKPAVGPRPTGPSITGADIKAGIGIPTEPERGNLSELEKALHGVK